MVQRLSLLKDYRLFPLKVNHFFNGIHPVRHLHDHAESELVFILAGTPRHLCAGESCALSPGDVLLIHPGTVHGYDHDHKSMELLNVVYDGSRMILPTLDLAEYPVWHRLFPEKPSPAVSGAPLMHLSSRELAAVLPLLSALELEANSQRAGHVFGTMAAFMQLLLALCRIESTTNTPQPCGEGIFRAVRYLNEHCTEPVAMQQAAMRAGLSLRNFYRFFPPAVGCSPGHYLFRIRIGKAMDMLVNSRLCISEIAYLCGFSDGNYFSKKFREFTGVTPSEFRRHPFLKE